MHYVRAIWEGARHPLVVSIVSIWAARLWSHVEHRGTSKKVEEIHGKLNGGLDKLIEEKVAKALEEKG